MGSVSHWEYDKNFPDESKVISKYMQNVVILESSLLHLKLLLKTKPLKMGVCSYFLDVHGKTKWESSSICAKMRDGFNFLEWSRGWNWDWSLVWLSIDAWYPIDNSLLILMVASMENYRKQTWVATTSCS